MKKEIEFRKQLIAGGNIIEGEYASYRNEIEEERERKIISW